jgi:hypothetical protein
MITERIAPLQVTAERITLKLETAEKQLHLDVTIGKRGGGSEPCCNY